MITKSLPKYDIKTIERMLGQLDNLPDKEKWIKIGLVFGKSHSAVHRWYYRQTKKQKEIKQSESIVEQKKRKKINKTERGAAPHSTTDIPTDVIRTVYLLLFGKGCRIGWALG